MTPADVITMALRRVGVETTTTEYRNQMLLYLNATITDIESRASGGWWFRFKSGTLTMVDGTKTYSLASDVLYPLSFRDSTNQHTLTMVDAIQADRIDPDASEEGSVDLVYMAGYSTTTGYPQVGFQPTPGAAATVAYRYYATQAPLTNANDTSDFLTTYGIPNLLHPALYFGAAKLYLQEEQDMEASMLQTSEYERIIKQALGVNMRMRGSMRLRLTRTHGPRGGSLTPSYQPAEGSLT